MRNKLFTTFDEDLKTRLKDPSFKKEWDKSGLEYQIARKIIQKRLFLKLSQRELAKKAKTTQAIISRLETAVANPTLDLLNKISKALNSQLAVDFK
ncbi:MAG: helix-turn-helix transcriptional regulator [Patescibacteria group bacterium]